MLWKALVVIETEAGTEKEEWPVEAQKPHTAMHRAMVRSNEEREALGEPFRIVAASILSDSELDELEV